MNQLTELFGENIAAEIEQEQRNIEALQSLDATGIVALFQTTPAQRNSFVDKVMDAVREGSEDAIKVITQVKSMQAIVETFTNKDPEKNKRADVAKEFADLVLDASQKYGKKFTAYGASFQEKEVGVKWDYSQCNDNELIELENNAANAIAKLKERQTYLQNLPAAGVEVVDRTCGDMVTIYKPSKSSTTALTVSLR